MNVLGPMGGAMNEAQKKLYKKLLKKIEKADEDDELAKLASEKLTPAEAFERRLALERKNEEMMRAKAERSLARKEEKEAYKKKIREEMEKKKEFEARRKKKEAEDYRLQQIAVKTHKFFRLNAYNKPQLTGVVYFGDTIREGEAWIPHGFGEYKVSGEVVYEGDFFHGKMHGKGTYLFANHDWWMGTFRFDDLHGVGMYTKHNPEGIDDDPPRECIYFKNRRVCFTDELLPGVHVRLLSDTHHSPGATILGRQKKRGHFRVKMDVGGMQNLNLADEEFEVDRAKPRITLLDTYTREPEGTAIPKRYDETAAALITERHENWFSDKLPPTTEADRLKALEEKKAKDDWERKKENIAREKLVSANRQEIAAAKQKKEEEEAEKKREKEEEEAELNKRRGIMIKEREKRQTMLDQQSASKK